MTEGLLGFAAMFALMALRMPIAMAMGLVGLAGLGLMRSWPAAMSAAAGEFVDIGSYTLSVVPLFVLMGNFVTRAGMSRDLYQAAYALIGHLRGGLAMSTIAACAGFGAICGSSIATTATMARVAMPEMQRFNYATSFAAGSICAGATLGILIPPSVILVIYGIMTEQSIGALFAAGVIPGLIATLFYLLASWWTTRRHPAYGPPGERATWAERGRALGKIWGVLMLFALVMGGMYGGFFTPTEAAGVGAMGGFLFALARRALTLKVLREVLVESSRTSAMLFTIVIGASLFANFLNFTDLPNALRDFVAAFDLHPIVVIIAICFVYVVLGTAMESLSMMLLTVPIFFPLVTSLGFDPVWFGIIIVCVIEISLITPPVGMNIFVLSSVLPHVPTTMIWRGVAPFIVADVLRMGVLIAFPVLSLALPKLLNL
ncbi:MAG: C4-dicarboxylate ABC transporter permease [Burkholderiales bacterium RIFCSPHIGHO2_12_FULL_69_20]|nr:MAG: C4-dicarboxylate ABC transporter permease [Burkholderiales bacterium RIFCSPHIGHO2_12_FULL_69_20]